MADRSKPGTDGDGVRVVADQRGGRSRRIGLWATAIVLVIAALVVIRGRERPRGDSKRGLASQETSDGPGRRSASGQRRGEHGQGAGAVRAVRVRQPDGAAAGLVRSPRPEERREPGADHGQPEIDAREYIAALRASGETDGLAAFSPPGTRPPVAGIIVPDDYELPEGFVRYYQSTDDGRQLAPILTLSPDYELIDENGDAIPLAGDRVVPPELAPPGLPLRMLEVPSVPGRAAGGR